MSDAVFSSRRDGSIQCNWLAAGSKPGREMLFCPVWLGCVTVTWPSALVHRVTEQLSGNSAYGCKIGKGVFLAQSPSFAN